MTDFFMQPLAVLLITLVLLATGGCSTVNRGVVDHLFVDSVPQGARATIDRGPGKDPIVCEATPCAIGLARTSDVIVRIDHDGYESVELLVTNTGKRVALAGSFAGNATSSGAFIGGAAAGGALFGNIISLGGGSSGLAGGAAASVAAPAAGFAAVMIVTDLSTGATRNLAPNPIVVALPPISAEALKDPRVELFREKQRLTAARDKVCGNASALSRSEACIESDAALTDVSRKLRAETEKLFSASSEEK